MSCDISSAPAGHDVYSVSCLVQGKVSGSRSAHINALFTSSFSRRHQSRGNGIFSIFQLAIQDMSSKSCLQVVPNSNPCLPRALDSSTRVLHSGLSSLSSHVGAERPLS